LARLCRERPRPGHVGRSRCGTDRRRRLRAGLAEVAAEPPTTHDRPLRASARPPHPSCPRGTHARHSDARDGPSMARRSCARARQQLAHAGQVLSTAAHDPRYRACRRAHREESLHDRRRERRTQCWASGGDARAGLGAR
jgi:hypothetical protein